MAKEIRKLTLAKQNNSRPQGQGAPGFQNQQRQQCQPPQSNRSSMEDLMKAFIIKTYESLDTHYATIKELGTSFQNLERQVGNIQEGEVRVDEDLRKKGKIKAQKKKKNDNSTNNETEERKCMHALPFSQKQQREKLDKQFERFLEVFKQVHVNIPFIEVLSQMPTYAKFMKEILSKKQKVEETSVVKLRDHCSAILQNKLPKMWRSREFNYNLLFRMKLEGDIGEIRLVPVSLQLTDHTTIIPEGIVEDVLVRVKRFVFPVDFIVVNMEENKEVPLILGRTFLATGRAILDIQERQLMLRVRDKRLIFKMEGERGALKEQIGKSEADNYGVYPKKVEKKLSVWMCALYRACKGDPDFDSDPD
ncbi:uncharacterized protein [Nicotiana tomentosiformis]|uniref:uncharacterized protein n=1 Tax=Nicotiana tomentosiformis TaxID=4098 RepID=UPI00388CE608